VPHHQRLHRRILLPTRASHCSIRQVYYWTVDQHLDRNGLIGLAAAVVNLLQLASCLSVTD